MCKPILPPSPPTLPEYRVSYEYPFEATDLDQAGPFYVRDISNNKRMKKCYILLLTCAATRAVHLELTAGQNQEPIQLALRLFIARRGISRLFISDNFKSFKTEYMKSFIRNNSISWEFILEKSPWWGGFYERLIGITKMCLTKTIGKARLKFDEQI